MNFSTKRKQVRIETAQYMYRVCRNARGTEIDVIRHDITGEGRWGVKGKVVETFRYGNKGDVVSTVSGAVAWAEDMIECGFL